MFENRRAPRFASLARARVADLSEGEALLKDISVTGCRLEFSAAVALSPDTVCRIVVLPEDAAAIQEFELLARLRWSWAGYDSFEIGFFIEGSPKGKAFQRYVDYLSWRAGSSGQA